MYQLNLHLPVKCIPWWSPSVTHRDLSMVTWVSVGYKLGCLFSRNFFLESRIWIPRNSIEYQWVSQLCPYRFQEKITVHVAWLLHTGMATSSNIFVPSMHSVGESPSQVPGQTCGPHELSSPPHAATLHCLLL